MIGAAPLDWQAMPHSGIVPPDVLNLFLIDLHLFEPASLGTLSSAEQQRGARFHFSEDQQHFFAARVAVREILASQLGCVPAAITFDCGSHGKPSVAAPAGSDLQFNLSHSDGLLLLATNRRGPVGVDLEEVRSDLEMEPLAEHYFSPEECWAVRTARGEERAWAFFTAWTAMEARLKAEGCGLGEELPASRFAAWAVTPLRIADRFAAAIACGHNETSMHTWTWPS